MKKLSIICGVVLVLALISAPAFAMSFKFDLCKPGACDGSFESTISIFESETVQVDIWLSDYTEPDEVKAADVFFFWHSASLDYISATASMTPGGDWAVASANDTLAASEGEVFLGVNNNAAPCPIKQSRSISPNLRPPSRARPSVG